MNKHSCKFITQWLILFGTVGVFALYIWFRYEQARQKQMSKDSSWFSYLPSLLKSGNVNDQTSSSWLSLVPSMLKSGSVEEGTRPNILLYIVECLWEDLLHLIDLVCKLAYKVAEFTIVIVSVCCVVGIIIVYQRNTKTSGRQNKDTSGKQTETSSSKQNISERRNKNIKQEHQTDHTENGNSASKMASSSYSVLLKWYSYMTTKKIENAKQPEKPKKKFKITFSALLKWFIFLTFVMFLASIPWEYIRLYQLEVAKRVSVMQLGIPKECVPHEMSIFQSMKHWITWHMSWQLDPCEKYHKAMLVDPMWEIPPLLVLWSALTRCLLHPVELFFGALGKSFRLFFSEIPAQWQPVMMILMILLFIFTLILSCGYRLSVPFFMKIEPKTPVVYRCEEKIQKTEKDLNEKKKLELKND